MAGALACIVTTLLVRLIGHSIRDSVQAISATAQGIADGRLDTRCRIANGEEFNLLGQAINGMANYLQRTIDQMRDDGRRDTFSNQLAEALEMTHGESDAYGVVGRGMEIVSKGNYIL